MAPSPFFQTVMAPGSSRESSIRLDGFGAFWHEGERIEHAGLEAALHRWIARHPENGRYILSNGHDWAYFQVDDAPYTVRSVRESGGRLVLVLSDGTEEELALQPLAVGADDALYVEVKGGTFVAKFTRHAQTGLAPYLVEAADGTPELAVGTDRFAVDRRRP